jgi:hypothetical protein
MWGSLTLAPNYIDDPLPHLLITLYHFVIALLNRWMLTVVGLMMGVFMIYFLKYVHGFLSLKQMHS